MKICLTNQEYNKIIKIFNDFEIELPSIIKEDEEDISIEIGDQCITIPLSNIDNLSNEIKTYFLKFGDSLVDIKDWYKKINQYVYTELDEMEGTIFLMLLAIMSSRTSVESNTIIAMKVLGDLLDDIKYRKPQLKSFIEQYGGGMDLKELSPYFSSLKFYSYIVNDKLSYGKSTLINLIKVVRFVVNNNFNISKTDAINFLLKNYNLDSKKFDSDSIKSYKIHKYTINLIDPDFEIIGQEKSHLFSVIDRHMIRYFLPISRDKDLDKFSGMVFSNRKGLYYILIDFLKKIQNKLVSEGINLKPNELQAIIWYIAIEKYGKDKTDYKSYIDVINRLNEILMEISDQQENEELTIKKMISLIKGREKLIMKKKNFPSKEEKKQMKIKFGESKNLNENKPSVDDLSKFYKDLMSGNTQLQKQFKNYKIDTNEVRTMVKQIVYTSELLNELKRRKINIPDISKLKFSIEKTKYHRIFQYNLTDSPLEPDNENFNVSITIEVPFDDSFEDDNTLIVVSIFIKNRGRLKELFGYSNRRAQKDNEFNSLMVGGVLQNAYKDLISKINLNESIKDRLKSKVDSINVQAIDYLKDKIVSNNYDDEFFYVINKYKDLLGDDYTQKVVNYIKNIIDSKTYLNDTFFKLFTLFGKLLGEDYGIKVENKIFNFYYNLILIHEDSFLYWAEVYGFNTRFLNLIKDNEKKKKLITKFISLLDGDKTSEMDELFKDEYLQHFIIDNKNLIEKNDFIKFLNNSVASLYYNDFSEELENNFELLNNNSKKYLVGKDKRGDFMFNMKFESLIKYYGLYDRSIFFERLTDETNNDYIDDDRVIEIINKDIVYNGKNKIKVLDDIIDYELLYDSEHFFINLKPELKKYWVQERIKRFGYDELEEYEKKETGNYSKYKNLQQKITTKGEFLSDEEFKDLLPKQKQQYLQRLKSDGEDLTDWEKNYLSENEIKDNISNKNLISLFDNIKNKYNEILLKTPIKIGDKIFNKIERLWGRNDRTWEILIKFEGNDEDYFIVKPLGIGNYFFKKNMKKEGFNRLSEIVYRIAKIIDIPFEKIDDVMDENFRGIKESIKDKLKSKSGNIEKDAIEFYSEKINNNEKLNLSSNIFDKLPITLKLKYLVNKKENNISIKSNEYEFLPDNIKNELFKKQYSITNNSYDFILKYIPTYYKGYSIEYNSMEGNIHWSVGNRGFYATPFWETYFGNENHIIPVWDELNELQTDIKIPQHYNNLNTVKEIYDFINNFYLPKTYETIEKIIKNDINEGIKLKNGILNESRTIISEEMTYHIENGLSLKENVFRCGSESYYNLINECRNLYKNNIIELNEIDKEIIESDLGKTVKTTMGYVFLDSPFLLEEFDETLETWGLMNESEYKGKKVKLNKPFRSSSGGKKYAVYVKNPESGNVKLIRFGDSNMRVGTGNKDRVKSFVARHKCHEKKDKTKAGYWACRLPQYGLVKYKGRFW
jgi:hypothetical protein